MTLEALSQKYTTGRLNKTKVKFWRNYLKLLVCVKDHWPNQIRANVFNFFRYRNFEKSAIMNSAVKCLPKYHNSVRQMMLN